MRIVSLVSERPSHLIFRFIEPIKFVSEGDSPVVDLPAAGTPLATRKRHRTIAIALSVGLVVRLQFF
jgi:hypothetical protein